MNFEIDDYDLSSITGDFESGSESGSAESGSDENTDDNSSDDEDSLEETESNVEEHENIDENFAVNKVDDGAISSDSNDERESCPICLNRFIGQDLGSPESCNHTFCLECILEWSKNINTCPIDRTEFHYIHVKSSSSGQVVKKIKVKVIPKEDEFVLPEDTTVCEICNSGDHEDRLLLCDGCDLAYHCECLDPPLRSIPIEEWFCHSCSSVLQNTASHSGLGRQRRVIPRTRASETIRSRIENRRNFPPSQRASTSLSSIAHRKPSGTTKTTKRPKKRRRRRFYTKVIKYARTKQSVLNGSKGKTSSRNVVVVKCKVRRRRRRRTKVKRLSSVSKTKSLTSKKRLASQLGIGKPSQGQTMPVVKRGAGSSTVSNQTSHSLFGNRNQLMDFSESYDDGPSSSTAVTSTSSLSPALATASSFNILDSIMAGQELLHKKSEDIIIKKDGSLELKRESDRKSALKLKIAVKETSAKSADLLSKHKNGASSSSVSNLKFSFSSIDNVQKDNKSRLVKGIPKENEMGTSPYTSTGARPKARYSDISANKQSTSSISSTHQDSHRDNMLRKSSGGSPSSSDNAKNRRTYNGFYYSDRTSDKKSSEKNISNDPLSCVKISNVRSLSCSSEDGENARNSLSIKREKHSYEDFNSDFDETSDTFCSDYNDDYRKKLQSAENKFLHSVKKKSQLNHLNRTYDSSNASLTQKVTPCPREVSENIKFEQQKIKKEIFSDEEADLPETQKIDINFTSGINMSAFDQNLMSGNKKSNFKIPKLSQASKINKQKSIKQEILSDKESVETSTIQDNHLLTSKQNLSYSPMSNQKRSHYEDQDKNSISVSSNNDSILNELQLTQQKRICVKSENMCNEIPNSQMFPYKKNRKSIDDYKIPKRNNISSKNLKEQIKTEMNSNNDCSFDKSFLDLPSTQRMGFSENYSRSKTHGSDSDCFDSELPATQKVRSVDKVTYSEKSKESCSKTKNDNFSESFEDVSATQQILPSESNSKNKLQSPSSKIYRCIKDSLTEFYTNLPPTQELKITKDKNKKRLSVEKYKDSTNEFPATQINEFGEENLEEIRESNYGKNKCNDQIKSLNDALIVSDNKVSKKSVGKLYEDCKKFFSELPLTQQKEFCDKPLNSGKTPLHMHRNKQVNSKIHKEFKEPTNHNRGAIDNIKKHSTVLNKMDASCISKHNHSNEPKSDLSDVEFPETQDLSFVNDEEYLPSTQDIDNSKTFLRRHSLEELQSRPSKSRINIASFPTLENEQGNVFLDDMDELQATQLFLQKTTDALLSNVELNEANSKVISSFKKDRRCNTKRNMSLDDMDELQATQLFLQKTTDTLLLNDELNEAKSKVINSFKKDRKSNTKRNMSLDDMDELQATRLFLQKTTDALLSNDELNEANSKVINSFKKDRRSNTKRNMSLDDMDELQATQLFLQGTSDALLSNVKLNEELKCSRKGNTPKDEFEATQLFLKGTTDALLSLAELNEADSKVIKCLNEDLKSNKKENILMDDMDELEATQLLLKGATDALLSNMDLDETDSLDENYLNKDQKCDNQGNISADRMNDLQATELFLQGTVDDLLLTGIERTEQSKIKTSDFSKNNLHVPKIAIHKNMPSVLINVSSKVQAKPKHPALKVSYYECLSDEVNSSFNSELATQNKDLLASNDITKSHTDVKQENNLDKNSRINAHPYSCLDNLSMIRTIDSLAVKKLQSHKTKANEQPTIIKEENNFLKRKPSSLFIYVKNTSNSIPISDKNNNFEDSQDENLPATQLVHQSYDFLNTVKEQSKAKDISAKRRISDEKCDARLTNKKIKIEHEDMLPSPKQLHHSLKKSNEVTLKNNNNVSDTKCDNINASNLNVKKSVVVDSHKPHFTTNENHIIKIKQEKLDIPNNSCNHTFEQNKLSRNMQQEFCTNIQIKQEILSDDEIESNIQPTLNATEKICPLNRHIKTEPICNGEDKLNKENVTNAENEHVNIERHQTQIIRFVKTEPSCNDANNLNGEIVKNIEKEHENTKKHIQQLTQSIGKELTCNGKDNLSREIVKDTERDCVNTEKYRQQLIQSIKKEPMGDDKDDLNMENINNKEKDCVNMEKHKQQLIQSIKKESMGNDKNVSNRENVQNIYKAHVNNEKHQQQIIQSVRTKSIYDTKDDLNKENVQNRVKVYVNSEKNKQRLIQPIKSKPPCDDIDIENVKNREEEHVNTSKYKQQIMHNVTIKEEIISDDENTSNQENVCSSRSELMQPVLKKMKTEKGISKETSEIIKSDAESCLNSSTNQEMPDSVSKHKTGEKTIKNKEESHPKHAVKLADSKMGTTMKKEKIKLSNDRRETSNHGLLAECAKHIEKQMQINAKRHKVHSGLFNKQESDISVKNKHVIRHTTSENRTSKNAAQLKNVCTLKIKSKSGLSVKTKKLFHQSSKSVYEDYLKYENVAAQNEKLDDKCVLNNKSETSNTSVTSDSTEYDTTQFSIRCKVENDLNLQEKIEYEVKSILKPFYIARLLSKEDYKSIMRKAVPKIYKNCKNTINQEKIKKLVTSYIHLVGSS